MASLLCPQGLLPTEHCREMATSVVAQGRVAVGELAETDLTRAGDEHLTPGCHTQYA